jgi:hypothetical protein
VFLWLVVVGAGASGRGAAGRGAKGQETGFGSHRSRNGAGFGVARGRGEMRGGAEEDTRLGAAPFGMGLVATGTESSYGYRYRLMITYVIYTYNIETDPVRRRVFVVWAVGEPDPPSFVRLCGTGRFVDTPSAVYPHLEREEEWLGGWHRGLPIAACAAVDPVRRQGKHIIYTLRNPSPKTHFRTGLLK